jgi:nucleotide-binding universal stress UspA family protein
MTGAAPFAGPIVCGIDFSEPARHAVTLASALASRLGSRLIAVTAIDPLLNEAAETQMGHGRFAADAAGDLERLVRAIPGKAAASAEIVATVGNPVEVLLEAAARSGASIVAVGTQGLGRTHRLVFGSTTLRLMRATQLPVLAVPPAAKGAAAADGLWFERIVCGVDFGEASITAARAAVELGRRLSVPVKLVYAAGRVAVPQAWSIFASSASDKQLHDADARLRKLVVSLGEPAPEFSVEPGEAAEVLDADALSGDPTLVVLGLGGAGGHRPGSTAIRVLAHTRGAVLTVPAATG